MQLSELDPDVLDPETGLPKIPEDFFFRFSRYQQSFQAQLMHKKVYRLFWLIPISHDVEWDYHFFYTLDKTEMQFATRYLVRAWIKRLESSESMLGDYPPKSLNR